MDIVHILADYSLGVAVGCSNKQCKSEIFYDLHYQVELDLRKSVENVKFNPVWRFECGSQAEQSVTKYQYVPKYVLDEGTHKIYGKNRRIFCEECTHNELSRCDHCLRIREVQPVTTKKWKKYRCHNHRNYAQVTAGL